MNTGVDAPSAVAGPAQVVSTHTRRRFLANYGMLLLLVAMIIIFSVLRPETFATAGNLRTVLLENSVLAILAMAVMVPLIANDMDLSVASMLGLASVLAAGMPSRQDVPVILMILVVLAVGVAVGLLHGLLIVKLGLPSVVVTLGSNTVLAGIILWYTGGAVIYEGVPKEFTALGTGNLFGIPLPVVYAAVILLVIWFVLEKRPWGRMIYATGSSRTAARLAGVRTDRVRMTALVASATLASIAGLVLTARMGSGNPTAHSAFFLPAFAAAFLSVAAFKIGIINPMGVVLAVLLLAVGVNGLGLLGVPSWVDQVFNGGALIIAIVVARLSSGGTSKFLNL